MKMKQLCLFFALAVLPLSPHAQAQAIKLKVSDNKRFIITDKGKPFVWLGDTAWELFHRLNREEATEYLTTRAKQGFTVIQAVVLAELDGLRVPNPYGEIPLHDFSPEKPNEKYFEHVDFIVNKAEELGLVIGMLPTWGDKLYSLFPGAGPVVFNRKNAAVFGEFLGKRYENKPIVWILGGDRNVDSLEVLEIWRAMALGLRKGDKGKHLISFHPRGEASSSYALHNEDWLDFNMYQSGHAFRYNKVYQYATNDYLLRPTKPFLDGEPAYEDLAVRFWADWDWKDALDENGIVKDRSYFKRGFFTAHDVRVHAYWDFLSGACGYTYGNNAVWQMFKKGSKPIIACLTDWREALDRPGANDMQHVRKLMEVRPLSKIIPDQSLVYGLNKNDSTHIRAAVASDNSFALAYLSVGQSITVVMKKIADKNIVAWWYDPRKGTSSKIGEFTNAGLQTFTPPSSGEGNDWVLILDSASKKYPKP